MKNLYKVHLVAHSTFKEIMKSRILYSTALIAVAIILITYVAKEFTYGTPGKVAIDFGLGMLSLSSMGIALFMGATLLTKEIETRTVYMVISRPVPRWCFILGKLMGLTAVLVVNVVALSILSLGCSYANGGVITNLAYIAIGFNLLEAILLMLLVVFISLFANPILAAITSFLLVLVGHGIQAAKETMFVSLRPALGKMLDFYHLVLPAFYKLNLKGFVVYNQGISESYIRNASLYGAMYCLCLFLLITYVFQRKNLD